MWHDTFLALMLYIISRIAALNDRNNAWTKTGGLSLRLDGDNVNNPLT